MNDFATLNATPRVMNIGGKDYRVEPLRIADFGKLQEWVDRQFGDPFAVANEQIASGRYNTAQQQFLFRVAMEIARQPKPKIGMPEADNLLRSVDGTKEMLYVSFSKGDPSFRREDADRLYADMTFGDIARFVEATNLDMVMSDPKGETAGETTPAG